MLVTFQYNGGMKRRISTVAALIYEKRGIGKILHDDTSAIVPANAAQAAVMGLAEDAPKKRGRPRKEETE